MNDKIDIELAEDEDLIRAKAWWKENGSSIIAGIVIGTTMVVGYNYWQRYQEKHALQVAQLYEAYSQAPQDNEALDQLLAVDSTAVYSQLARLTAAKQAVEAEQYDQAEKMLEEVMTSADDQGLRSVAILRKAAVYLAQDKTDDALALLDKQAAFSAPLMQARIAELKADANLAKGEAELARGLYESSISLLEEAGQAATLVQLKLDNL